MWTSVLWKKVMMNVTHMSMNQEKHYIIEAWNSLSEWSEARALASLNLTSVVKFLWEDVICQHECFQKLICDKESENKNVIKILAEKYEIHWIIISSYNSQANEMIEVNHRLIINALLKLIMRETLTEMND